MASSSALPLHERADGPSCKPTRFDGEHQFRLLVSGVRDYALYMLDPDGRVASWNAGAQNIKGYTEEEILGEHFSKFYTAGERAAGVPMDSLRLAAEQGRFESEAQRVRKDGSLFWANVVIQPIRGDDEELVGFAKITRDITERHRNEERLREEVVVRREAERATSAANERLLDAINSINDGFAIYDAEDNLLIHNQRYLEMHASVGEPVALGASFEELVRGGLDSGEGPVVAPSDTQVEARLTRHRAADGAPHIQKIGQTWVMASERSTREGGVVVIETDITDLKQADIIKDEFLAMVSHELRTPLTPIHGALSLIASGKIVKLTDNLAELVEVANRNCGRLISIVDDLLDFTRVSGPRFSIDCRRIALVPFLEHIMENKAIGPASRQIKLSIAPDVMNAEVDADPIRIQQVLDNLLSNAIKFTDPDDCIEVVIERRDESLRVAIVDHGPGIGEDFVDRVFEPFVQADSSSTRRNGGVGLGLSIAKSIVEAHGGSIGFTSEEGVGTTFYFELPLPPQNASNSKGARAA